jgi:hypothetical protein
VTTRIWQTGGDRRRRAQMTPPEVALESAALAMAYRHTFATEQGRTVLADLLRRAGIMQSSFSSDPLETAYREGRRRLGLEIVEAINRDPEAVLAMVTSGETNSLFPNPAGDDP